MQEPALILAMEILWDQFAAHAPTKAAAARMLAHAHSCPIQSASCLGRTPFNAYSFNINYRTGMLMGDPSPLAGMT